MEYVARLFTEGGGFQGIADTHNAALERAKAETEAASDLVLNSHGSRLTKHYICIAQNMGEPPRHIGGQLSRATDKERGRHWESRGSPSTPTESTRLLPENQLQQEKTKRRGTAQERLQ